MCIRACSAALPAPKGCAGEGASCFGSCTEINAMICMTYRLVAQGCLRPGWPAADEGGSGPAAAAAAPPPPPPPVVAPRAGTRPNCSAQRAQRLGVVGGPLPAPLHLHLAAELDAGPLPLSLCAPYRVVGGDDERPGSSSAA